MFRPRRSAVKVRLNRSLFPADLITITPTGKTPLTDVGLDYGFANDVMKVRSGDGDRMKQLVQGEAIDIFVHGGHSLNLEIPPLRLSRLQVVRRGRPLLIMMDWSSDQGEEGGGQLCIAWTHEDRTAGLQPRLAFGEDAEILASYVRQWEKPVTGQLLRLHRRVPDMTQRDIKARVRWERKGTSVAMDPEKPIRVASIAIRGFRGFREEATLRLAQPTDKPGSGLTIVVGANNTGKSTVWESFDAIARRLKGEVSFSEGRRNRKTPDGVWIQLRRADTSTYTLESRNADTSETRASWEPDSPQILEPEIVSVPSRRQFESRFGRNMTSQRDWMSNGQEFSRGQQTGQFSQFTGRLFDLHNDDIKKAHFDELMTRVLGAPLEWTIELGDGSHGQSYYLKVTTGEGENHTSEGLGDGIISILFILNALYDSEPGTLLVLDEPELSLHPQLVRRLGRELARFAKDRQIVIFTHSPLLVSWDDIKSGAEIARVYKVEGDSRIAQVPRETVDELSKARGGWKNPHVLGQDATEALFLDDEIIVVEGQEDSGLLPTVYEEAGISRRGTIFGWGAGGGDGNPQRIVALLNGLGFEKVVALLDADKTDEVRAIRDAYPTYFATTIPADDIREKPAYNFGGKSGLLDKDGKRLKPDQLDATRAALESVTEYFAGAHDPPDAAVV